MSNVLQTLEESPALLATAAEVVAKAKEALDRAKHHAEVCRAAATIANQSAKNSTLLQAHVSMDPAVQEADLEIIRLSAELEIARLQYDRLYNAFLSSRKLAGMDDRELHALRGSTIQAQQ
jgi:hypothetical protein